MRRPARLSLPRDRREVSRALSAAKGDILWAKERFTVYSRPSSTRFFHALVITSFSGCVTSDGFVRSFGGRHPSPSRRWRLPRHDQTHRLVLSAATLSFGLALAPAAFADDAMKKDTMSKDSMSKDSMKKDSVSKDSMSKDTMSRDSMSNDSMKKDDMKKN